MSFASPNLQEIAQERYGAPKVWHVSTAGNDSTGDGLSWGTAYATVFKAASVATAGHLILCGAGTIDEGANTVTLADGVSLRGAGKYATTLTNSRTDGFVLLPGNNSRVGDLTILSTPGGSNFTFPVGCNVASDGSGAKTGVALERVAIVGHTDGLYFQDFGSVSVPVSIGWTLTDCDVTTDYDAVAVLLTKNVAGTVDLFWCRISTNGSAVGTARSVNNESAVTVRLYDCDLSATGGVGGGSNNACVYAQGQTGSNAFAARVELRGCRLNAVPASGAAYDANANPQASILAVDCSGSGTDGLLLTTGAVTVTGRDRVAAVKAQTAAAAQQANALAALAATQTNSPAAGSAAAGLAAAAAQSTAANAKLILSGNNRLLAVPQDEITGGVILAYDGPIGVVVQPLAATIAKPQVGTANLTIAQYSQPPVAWTCNDSFGNPVNLSGKLVRLEVFFDDGVSDTGIFAYDTAGVGHLAVSGTSNNVVTASFRTSDTSAAAVYVYELWNMTDLIPLAKGTLAVERSRITVP